MKTFLILTLCALSFNAQAAVERRYQDLKLPSQLMVERQAIDNPAAAGTVDVLSANAGNTSAAAASVSSFIAQPDVPRNLVITPGTSTVDVAACNVVVSGTNYLNQSTVESFFFTNDQSAATTGELAFKTISSVAFPANCEDGAFAATWSVGYGEKLGIKRCLRNAGNVLGSTSGGAWESTRPTIAAGSSVQGNTADFNSTMNGSNDFELFFFQNYTCL